MDIISVTTMVYFSLTYPPSARDVVLERVYSIIIIDPVDLQHAATAAEVSSWSVNPASSMYQLMIRQYSPTPAFMNINSLVRSCGERGLLGQLANRYVKRREPEQPHLHIQTEIRKPDAVQKNDIGYIVSYDQS